MQLKNCVECGKLFVHLVSSVCQDCYEKEEKQFKKVREYLWSKEDASIAEIHEHTQVPEKKIIRFIREGRIKGHGIQNVLLCEGCGQPISEGNYCSRCRGRLMNELSDKPKKPTMMGERKDKKVSNKMFTADRHRR